MGVSCFTGNRLLSLRPNRSSVASTGRNREPLGQNVFRSVAIPVVPDATLGADPLAYIKWEVFDHMLAVMTRFTGGIPTVNYDEGSRVPLAFVLQLADELTPSHITDGFCQRVILDHVLDGQTLHANHLVFANYACRELLLVVTSAVLDTGMHACYFPTCFLSVLGTFLFLGVPTLGFCESLLIFCVVAGIAYSLTSREDHHRFESQVQPNLRTRHRELMNLLFHQHRDKVAVGTVF